MCLNGVRAKINIFLIFGRLNSLFVVHQVIFKRLAQRCKSTPAGLDLLEVILSWPCKYSSLAVTLDPYYHAFGCGQYGYSACYNCTDLSTTNSDIKSTRILNVIPCVPHCCLFGITKTNNKHQKERLVASKPLKIPSEQSEIHNLDHQSLWCLRLHLKSHTKLGFHFLPLFSALSLRLYELWGRGGGRGRGGILLQIPRYSENYFTLPDRK